MKRSILSVLDMLESDVAHDARKWRVTQVTGYVPSEVHDGGYNVVIDTTDGRVFLVAENYSRGDCTLIAEATAVMDDLMTAFKNSDIHLANRAITTGRKLLDNSSVQYASDMTWFVDELHDDIPSLNIKLKDRVALLGDGLLGTTEEAIYIGDIADSLQYMMLFVSMLQIRGRERKTIADS